MGKKSKRAIAAQTSEKSSSNNSIRKIGIIVISALLLVLAAVGINAYEVNQKELHDLNVIGQGAPVIVQIHDPNCPTCRRLKSIVTNSLDSHDSVLFRLANIATPEGKALQTKYAVPHVTLLFFDPKGKHVHTTTGLQTTAQINAAVSTYLTPT